MTLEVVTVADVWGPEPQRAIVLRTKWDYWKAFGYPCPSDYLDGHVVLVPYRGAPHAVTEEPKAASWDSPYTNPIQDIEASLAAERARAPRYEPKRLSFAEYGDALHRAIFREDLSKP